MSRLVRERQDDACVAPTNVLPNRYNRPMQVGIIGWRGMVGSVLVQRMREERDFDLIDPVFFSTSQAGAAGARDR